MNLATWDHNPSIAPCRSPLLYFGLQGAHSLAGDALSKQVLPFVPSSPKRSLPDPHTIRKRAEPPSGNGGLRFYMEPTLVAKSLTTRPLPSPNPIFYTVKCGSPGGGKRERECVSVCDGVCVCVCAFCFTFRVFVYVRSLLLCSLLGASQSWKVFP